MKVADPPSNRPAITVRLMRAVGVFALDRPMYIPHENLCMDCKSGPVGYIAGTLFVCAEVITKAGPGGNRGEFTA